MKFVAFDFDTMARLARETPDEFMRLRGELLDAALGTFTDTAAGARLQAAIDVERYRSGIASAATSRVLADMLQANIEELNALTRRLSRAAVPEEGAAVALGARTKPDPK